MLPLLRITPGPTLPSRLLGWLDDGRRATMEFTRRKLLEDRRERLESPFITSPMAEVVPGLLRAAGVRDAVLVLRDKVDAEGVWVASCSLRGRSEMSRSSTELDASGTRSSEEPRSETLVLSSSGSAQIIGELVCDSGDSSGLATAQPKTATCTPRLVCTLLGRERRERVDSDAMTSALGGCWPAGSMVAEGIAARV